jgi:hypothetical protein
MPNWCNNYATLTGPKEKIDALIVELRKSDERDESYQILNTLRPNPSGEWEYDWSVNNWGTKWDVSIAAYEIVDENTVSLSFDSAWSPPTTLYEFLQEEGWNVDAYYYEPGMGYCGHYLDGEDDYYEYGGMSADEAEEMIPSDINDMFMIVEDMRQWEEDNPDDEWDPAEELDKIEVPK